MADSKFLHIKGSRTQVYKTLPSNDVGNDGDIILSQIQGRGVYLCSKVNGRWHVSSKMEELRKIEKTSTKDFKTDKLRVLDDLSIGRGTTQITKDEAKFSSSLKIKEAANAISDTAAYGQLWVKTATPNELYFTTDAGNDIQITSGTATAFVGDITGVTAGDGLSGGGSSGAVSLAVSVDDSTIEINSDTLRVKDDGITYSKIQNVSATDRILGRDSSGAGVIEEITPANLRTMINVEDGATADQTKSDIDGLAITTVGTIDTGTWEGTTIAVDQGGTGATNSNAWLNSRITTNADGSLNYDATGATAVNHDSLAGFVSNEHIDWTGSSAGTIHSSNYTNTTYTGGTNLTLDGTEFDVDDAFLVNDADDTTTGTITAGGFTTTGTWTFDDATSGTVGITTIHTGSSFTDNDTSLMTAGAIKEKIEDYGYTTASGDITGVTITTDSGGGSAASDTGGSADFSILGSNGVGVTNSGTTITAVAVPAEIDHDSLNNFAANEHIDWTASSAGTIHSTNYSNTMGSGFTVSATTDSNATTITQGDDLMFAAGTGITCETTADGTVTISSTVTDTNTTYSAGSLLDLSTTTFNVDLTELTDGTADVVGADDELVYLDDGVQKRKQIDEIKLGQFNNDQGWTSNTGDITAVTAGTNCSGGGTSGGVTINVDDAFLVNDADDTTSGTITAAGFTTTGTWTFDTSAGGTTGITQVNVGSAFTDNDTTLMSAGAIKEKIEDYGYTTNTGDITGVDLTGGTGISIDSETNTTSGSYSATITCNLEGTEVVSTGETGGNKYLREDGDGTCSWQTVSASGNFVTDNADDTMAGTLTIDKNSTLTSSGTIRGIQIDLDHTGNTASGQSIISYGLEVNVNDDAATHTGGHYPQGIQNVVTTDTTGVSAALGIYNEVTGGDFNYGFQQKVEDGGLDLIFLSSADTGDSFSIATTTHGATTLTTTDDDAAAAHLTLDPDGDLIISGADTKIDSGKNLYLDGGGDTYVTEHAAGDRLLFYVGGDSMFQLEEKGDNGNEVYFYNSSAGFNRQAATFSTSGVIGDGNDSTDVDFRFSNKYKLTLTNNISGSSEYINMIFPSTSGNFLLTVVQDGTGSRTVASAGWRAYASDETLCDNTTGTNGTDGQVRWAGGSSPTLTTGANKTDVISIYWDADDQTAFCVATLNF